MNYWEKIVSEAWKKFNLVAEECFSYGIKNLFISGLVYTARMFSPVIERLIKKLKRIMKSLKISVKS